MRLYHAWPSTRGKRAKARHSRLPIRLHLCYLNKTMGYDPSKIPRAGTRAADRRAARKARQFIARLRRLQRDLDRSLKREARDRTRELAKVYRPAAVLEHYRINGAVPTQYHLANSLIKHLKAKSRTSRDPSGFIVLGKPLTHISANTGTATSFHFKLTNLSRGTVLPRDQQPFGITWGATGATTNTDGRAGLHQRYIERSGATPLQSRMDTDLGHMISDEMSSVRTPFPNVIRPRRPPAIDAAFPDITYDIFSDPPLKPTDVTVLTMVGNLGHTLAERVDTWSKIEKLEKPSQGPTLVADLSQDPAWWLSIAANPDAPEILREALKARRGRRDQYIPGNEIEIDNALSWAIANGLNAQIEITASGQTIVHRGRSADGQYVLAPLRKSDGLAGRVQRKLVFQIPHELSVVEMHSALEKFATETFGSRHVPYWAVIHKPDPHGDDRNYHVHLVFYERPADRLPDGRWDFEQYDPTIRARDQDYKLRPKDKSLHDRAFVGQARIRWAEIVNEHLAAGGHARRYDPRSNLERGLPPSTDVHLGKAAAMERRGATSIIGIALTEAQIAVFTKTIAENRTKRMTATRAALRRLGLFTPEAAAVKTIPEVKAVRDLVAEFIRIERAQVELNEQFILHQISRQALARPTGRVKYLTERLVKLEKSTQERHRKTAEAVRADLATARGELQRQADQLGFNQEALVEHRATYSALRDRSREIMAFLKTYPAGALGPNADEIDPEIVRTLPQEERGRPIPLPARLDGHVDTMLYGPAFRPSAEQWPTISAQQREPEAAPALAAAPDKISPEVPAPQPSPKPAPETDHEDIVRRFMVSVTRNEPPAKGPTPSPTAPEVLAQQRELEVAPGLAATPGKISPEISAPQPSPKMASAPEKDHADIVRRFIAAATRHEPPPEAPTPSPATPERGR